MYFFFRCILDPFHVFPFSIRGLPTVGELCFTKPPCRFPWQGTTGGRLSLKHGNLLIHQRANPRQAMTVCRNSDFTLKLDACTLQRAKLKARRASDYIRYRRAVQSREPGRSLNKNLAFLLLPSNAQCPYQGLIFEREPQGSPSLGPLVESIGTASGLEGVPDQGFPTVWILRYSKHFV